ncbi:MAG: hypothetical protein OEL50_01040 [Rhodospirillaceae bacterium]|nr:hypothetical protein [Rhodospirillaceae bacterium]
MGDNTKKRLHELPLEKREIKINRKWAMWIGIGLAVLVAIDGTLTTIIFMIRKGLW